MQMIFFRSMLCSGSANDPLSLTREASVKHAMDSWMSFLGSCCTPFVLVLLFAVLPLAAQQQAPAVPLVTHSPYFSIWSTSDTLTGSNTKHWTGSEQRLSGLVRADGKTFRYMGADPQKVPAMRQVSMRISPLHTDGFHPEKSGRDKEKST
jgi:Domain of unknown function (DUF4964)